MQWFAFDAYFMVLIKSEVMVKVSSIAEALRQHLKGKA